MSSRACEEEQSRDFQTANMARDRRPDESLGHWPRSLRSQGQLQPFSQAFGSRRRREIVVQSGRLSSRVANCPEWQIVVQGGRSQRRVCCLVGRDRLATYNLVTLHLVLQGGTVRKLRAACVRVWLYTGALVVSTRVCGRVTEPGMERGRRESVEDQLTPSPGADLENQGNRHDFAGIIDGGGACTCRQLHKLGWLEASIIGARSRGPGD